MLPLQVGEEEEEEAVVVVVVDILCFVNWMPLFEFGCKKIDRGM